MEFNKSKVYTALNAYELEIGRKVIVADNLLELKQGVLKDRPETLIKVYGEDTQYRFEAAGDKYAFAYLVSEPEKLKWTDLKVGDVICKGTHETMVLAIDRYKDTCNHILTCVYKDLSTDLVWIGDKELEEWEKIENDND